MNNDDKRPSRRSTGRGRCGARLRGRCLGLRGLHPARRRGEAGGTAEQHAAARLAVSVLAHVLSSSACCVVWRRMQRKPMWLMPVSTICAWRAAGR